MMAQRPALRRCVCLYVCVLIGAVARGAEESAPAAPAKADESWQVIEMGGARVGYGHIASYHRTAADGTQIVVTDMLNYMRLSRFGQQLEMTVRQHTEETADGQLLSFRFQMDNPPISSMKTVGTIEGDQLTLQTHANGEVEATTVEWDSSVKSPAWQERDLELNPLKPGESRSFPMYDPQLNQVATITLTESGPARTKLLDGTEIDTTRIVVEHSSIPVASNSYMDKSGEVVKTEVKLLSLVTHTVDRETALKELEDQPVDLAIETLVKVKPIANAHERKRIVYRVTAEGGDAAEHFPTGSTQQVERVSETVADVTVSATPDAAASGTGTPPGSKYLKATRFLDCDNARVAEHAKAAAARNLSTAAAARAMEKYVHSAMEDKNFATGLATASEVAENLEGDCTEHAVLLAAMLRAREIPARVAVGLVYSERHSAFAGHMWTEAYLDGVWTPLDATLGRGGIGAAHIKVADSALDENAPTPIAAFLPMIHLLGQMSIEVVSAE